MSDRPEGDRLAVLEAAVEQMPIAVGIIEAPSGRLVLANAEMHRIFRLADDPPVAGVSDYVHFVGYRPDGRRYQPEEWPGARALLHGETTTAEDILIRRADDTRTTIRVSASPIRDDSGAIVAAVATFYDVDEHGLAERALRESEERHKLVALAAQEYLWEIDFVRQRVRYSEAMHTVFGHREMPLEQAYDEALDIWAGHIHPEDRARVVGRFEELFRNDEVVANDEYRFRLGDGSYALVSDRYYVVRRADGSIARIVGAVSDISERGRAEEARRRLAGIVEATDDCIFYASWDLMIQTWNRGAERIFGWSREEIVGRSVLVLTPPERAQEIHASRAALERDGHLHVHSTWRTRKDGSEVEVSISLSLIRDQAGEVAGVAVIMRDLSDLRSLEAQLALADRMASLGLLAASVGHEINNPLTYVAANLELIHHEIDELMLCTGEPAVQRRLAHLATLCGDARDGSQRIASIVRDLRTLAPTATAGERVALDLREVADLALRIAAAQVRHHARVVRDYGEVPIVLANEAHLVQVFINLIVNAAQAIPEGSAERNEIRVVLGRDAEGRAAAEVHDTGGGIAPDLLPRIFEPLFTTKPSGGMGLGLAICRRIVAAEGGEIAVESTPGKGTSVHVTLPAAVGPSEHPPDDVAPGETPPRRARVLIVDDEPRLAMTMRRCLEAEHDVEMVTSGVAALALLRAGRAFDVILCDLMMPAMTGMDLHAELERSLPEQATRMVFLTGGAFTTAARKFLDHTGSPVIEKPFDVMRLRALVLESLEKTKAE
jgi:PAS domain S-box-containing protein